MVKGIGKTELESMLASNPRMVGSLRGTNMSGFLSKTELEGLVTGSVLTADLADGVLTADVAGRAKMADDFVVEAKINDGAVATAKIADAGVTPPKVPTEAVVALADADAVLTAAQMIDSGIFTITPTVARALTTDTAANIIAAMAGYQIGTWFDITIACLAGFVVTLAAGVGVTIVGVATVNNVSGTWRVVITAADAVVIYRK